MHVERHAWRAVVAVAIAAVAVSGCQLLFPAFYPPPSVDDLSSFEPDFSEPPDVEPSPIATYTKGHATITLADGTTVELDRVGQHSGLSTDIGLHVQWSNAAGWYLGLGGPGTSGGPFLDGNGPSIGLDRIVGIEHLEAYDDGKCVFMFAVADQTGVRGTAACTNLRWESLVGDPVGSPRESEPPFSFKVAFEATR